MSTTRPVRQRASEFQNFRSKMSPELLNAVKV